MSLQLATVSSPVHEASLDFDGTVDAIKRLGKFYDFLDQAVSSMPTRRDKKASLRTNHRYPLRIIKSFEGHTPSRVGRGLVEADALDPHFGEQIHDLRKHSGFDGSIGSW